MARLAQAALHLHLLAEGRKITTDELRDGWAIRWHDAPWPHQGELPGVANAWPYPIENRITSLDGHQTPVGINYHGAD